MHTVTITELPNDQHDDVLYEFGGDHDDNCVVFRECLKDWHRHPDYERLGDEEWSTKRAGHHHYINGSWMVRDKGNCALNFVFEGETAEEVLTEVGKFFVHPAWEGEYWSLEVAYRGETVYGALARAAAKAEGDPDWMYVTSHTVSKYPAS